MDENTRSQWAEAHSFEATGANTLSASQAAQPNAPSSSTSHQSISKAAAWVENTELTLQPQLHSTTNTQTHTTSGVQPRAVQEVEGSPGKKQKQKQEHDGPDAKSQKYDRQLRLWGANGQAALENAHVCLVNNGCGTVGIETLKNLVLPGIGNFTIIDNKLVSEEDLGVNFFLEESQLGKSRGECLRDMLCELNPDVTGHWAQQLGDMSHYDLFIRTTPSKDIPTRNMLERYCFDMQKPLITINSQGFYAYFHVQFSKDFPIVETHPEETAIRDFRILNPWPELARWAAELTDDLENQSNHKHGHVPWLALMLYYIRKWQVEHKTEDGQPGLFTGSFKQQKELAKMIQSGIRYDNGEGGEENFDQAHANVMKTVRHPALSSKVKEIFELCDQEPYRHSKDTFWHLARALKAFHKKNQRLPLAGSIPDMKAESEVYVQLQNLYKARAKRDIDEVKSYITPTILANPGMEDEVAIFCKNAETLYIVRQRFVGHDTVEEMVALTELARTGKQIEEFEIISNNEANVASGAASGERPDLAIMPKPPLEYIVIALRAMETRDVVDMADMEPGAIQGAISDMLTPPADYVQSWAAKEIGQSKLMPGVVREVERARGGELHNTASLVGGLVSQEVIKVVTKQYVPVDNLVVWDGVFCRMATFKL